MEQKEKLVRDLIPQIMRECGVVPRTRRAESQGQQVRVCCEKLEEEIEELLKADGPDEVTEESADVIEVVQLHARLYGIRLEAALDMDAHLRVCCKELRAALEELLDAATPEEVVKESHTMMRMVANYAHAHAVTIEHILRVKDEKLRDKGGFEDWILLQQ